MELITICIVAGCFSLILLFGGLCIDYSERRCIRKEKAAERARKRAEAKRLCMIALEAYDKHGNRIGVDHYTINKGA